MLRIVNEESDRFSSYKVLSTRDKKFSGKTFTAKFDIPSETNENEIEDTIEYKITPPTKAKVKLEHGGKSVEIPVDQCRTIAFKSATTGYTNRDAANAEATPRSGKLSLLIASTLKYLFEYYIDYHKAKGVIPKVFTFHAAGDADNSKKKAYFVFSKRAVNHKVPFTLGNPETALANNQFFLVYKPLYDKFTSESQGENND